jgi:hypothetical protein
VRVEVVELDMLELQLQNARIMGANGAFSQSPMLTYRRMLRDIQEVVERNVPEGATVLVISRGDDDAIEFAARRGWHFPQDEDGTFSGSYPETSEDAVAQLESLRERGARYLLVPGTSAWWLDHYDGLARHLRERYRPLAERSDCVLYELEGAL